MKEKVNLRKGDQKITHMCLNFCLAFMTNLKNNYLLKKLLKPANKKFQQFNI